MDISLWCQCTFLGCLGAREQIPTTVGLHVLHCCISPGSYACQEFSLHMDLLLQSRHAFLWSCTFQEHIPGYKDPLSWFCYTFIASYTDQEQDATPMDTFSLPHYKFLASFTHQNIIQHIWIFFKGSFTHFWGALMIRDM